jgi:hypothetical protein
VLAHDIRKKAGRKSSSSGYETVEDEQMVEVVD